MHVKVYFSAFLCVCVNKHQHHPRNKNNNIHIVFYDCIFLWRCVCVLECMCECFICSYIIFCWTFSLIFDVQCPFLFFVLYKISLLHVVYVLLFSWQCKHVLSLCLRFCYFLAIFSYFFYEFGFYQCLGFFVFGVLFLLLCFYGKVGKASENRRSLYFLVLNKGRKCRNYCGATLEFDMNLSSRTY